MKKLLYTLSLALLGTLAYAQVKIGADPGTISSASALEVQASNGVKVMVDKTTGYLGAGIIDPGQSIDAAGTARLRNIPTNTSNNLILTVDANGVISKQNAQAAQLSIAIPNLGAGVDLPADGIMQYTGTSIVIPANSKYIVTTSQLIGLTIPPSTNQVVVVGDQYGFIRSTFSDSPTTFTFSPDIVSSLLISGNISKGKYGMVTGSIILRNTSNAPKTYYYWANLGPSSTNDSSLPTGTNARLFGGSAWAENSMYAIPVN